MMKNLLFTLMLFAFSVCCYGQTLIDGDYRSAKTTGNWSDANMWEKRNGGVWTITPTAPTLTNNVYIQAGHTVTVDIANANVNDLQLSIAGVVNIGANVLNVNGKIRAFNNPAVTGSADGIYTTNTAPVVTMLTTTTGVLKFIGGTRNITNTGEWAASGTLNAAEFALDPGAVGTLVVGTKFRPTVISSGTIATGGFMSSGNGDFTIKTGATLSSTRSGTTSAVLGNSSTTKCGTFTIEDGATLELGGSTPVIDVTTFVNNGIVNYSRAGTQTFLQKGADATSSTALNDYSTLIISGTSSKTAVTAITVSKLLKAIGTSSINSASALVTLLNNATIERGVVSGTTFPSAVMVFGVAGGDITNVVISATIDQSNELPSNPTPGKIGTLTVNSGITYNIKGGRTITNLLNNGIMALAPSTGTLTFVINGTIAGTGSISGNVNGSLTVGGADGDAGTLKFTAGTEFLNNLLINRTGTNPSLTLGSSVTLSNDLILTSGVLHIMPNQVLTLSPIGSINGAPFSTGNYINTQNVGANVGILRTASFTGEKTFPVGNNGSYLPVTLNPTTSSVFDINVFTGLTANAAPDGTAKNANQKRDNVDAVWNINRTAGSGNADLTLAWPAVLEGSNFTSILDAEIGIGQYTGTYGLYTGTGSNTANTATSTFGTFTPFVVGKIGTTTLPVSLIDFTAKKQSNTVQLSWTTVSEQHNAHFMVERATDGVNFTNIGRKNGAGTSNSILYYTFADFNPGAGLNYYRLVQYDTDGKSTTTQPVFVNMGFEVLSLKVIQAASTSELNLNFTSPSQLAGQLSVYNLSGQKLLGRSLTVESGKSTVSMGLPTIAPGVYIAVYQAGDQIVREKFIK